MLRFVSSWLLALTILLGGVALGSADAGEAKGKAGTTLVKGKKKGKKGKKKAEAWDLLWPVSRKNSLTAAGRSKTLQ